LSAARTGCSDAGPAQTKGNHLKSGGKRVRCNGGSAGRMRRDAKWDDEWCRRAWASANVSKCCSKTEGSGPVLREAGKMEVLAKITEMLDGAAISYSVITHAPAGNTEVASRLRGHPLSAAAKSLLLRARYPAKTVRKYLLAVIPGDRMLDLSSVAEMVGAKKIGFAGADELYDLTGCVSGSVPPFCFNSQVELLADCMLRQNAAMVFNAGRLDVSIRISTDDYFRNVKSTERAISRDWMRVRADNCEMKW
jgi:Ala-tRNA(Pro) deacylase